MAPVMADATEVLRERLLTRDTVFLGRSTKKVLLKFQQFASVALGDDGATEEKVRSAAQAMTRELKLLVFEVQKSAGVHAACAQELKECDELEEETTAKIAHARTDIERLQGELGRERKARERKEEYEALAKLINEVAPRHQSRVELEALAAELSALEAESAELTGVLSSRAARYELLLQTIDDLDRSDLELQAADERRKEDLDGRKRKANGDDA
ncbi:Tho complex subunit 7-domain-containing protein [Pelagophyceae sp. CCMP2097]|nr:Tho complex subunit 7-domain-containing protein [Pelagophyceae sp. CCMP2097]